MRTACPRTPPSRLRRLPAVVAATVLAILVTASGAQAHTGLTSSNPAAGAAVTAPIDAVELTFSGPVLLRAVSVAGPDGADVTSGPAGASGSVVTAPVSLTVAGPYTVTYVVTSDDGHVLEGSLTFDYAPPVTATPPPAGSSTATTSPASPTPSAAEPSEAASADDVENSGGLLPWVVAVLAVVVVGAGLLVVRRLRARG